MPLAQQHGLMPLRGRACWVVGCGFLGSALVEACRAEGAPVLGFDRELPADVQGDAADAALLAEAKARLLPEVIFCCAATHGGDEAAYRAAYLALPRALHEACPQARLLFCSSSSVYAGQGGALVEESSPCCAVSPRARLLLEAEAAVLSWGGVVARLVPLYGGGRCELLRRLVQGEACLPGAGGRMLNYVHRADAVQALLLLASLPGPPRVVNVCGESFAKGAVYGELERLTGLSCAAAASAAGRRGCSDQRVSSALLRSLGWRPQHEFLSWASAFWKNREGA